MKRRSKTRTTPVHVTIPVRVLEDLDDSLSFKQSRSRIITKLIENYLEGDQVYIGSMTKIQIIASLLNQYEHGSNQHVLLKTLFEMERD